MRLLLRSLLTLCLLAQATHALVVDTALSDPAREAQAQQLFRQMRCVVCEGQSLADSDATFAQQMRREIRRQLREGASPASITAYFTQRYGDTILMAPPLKTTTALLWGMPLLLLAVAGFILRRHHRGDRS